MHEKTKQKIVQIVKLKKKILWRCHRSKQFRPIVTKAKRIVEMKCCLQWAFTVSPQSYDLILCVFRVCETANFFIEFNRGSLIKTKHTRTNCAGHLLLSYTFMPIPLKLNQIIHIYFYVDVSPSCIFYHLKIFSTSTCGLCICLSNFAKRQRFVYDIKFIVSLSHFVLIVIA